jgi:hypothetical protein
MKTPGWIYFRRALPPSIHGRVLPHSEAESIGANSRIGAIAERREADFPSAPSAGHQLRTKAKRQKRKDYYVDQCQNTKGLQIGQP